MSVQAEVVETVTRLAPRDGLAARLLLCSFVTTILNERGQTTIVVGGTAVDAYVAGGFGTSESLPAQWQESLDIDTIVIKTDPTTTTADARTALEQHGFTGNPSGTGSLRMEGIPFPIDIVGDWFPDGYSRGHIVTMHLEEAQELDLEPVELAGPEDILFDYMESGWDTRHQRDWARALAVAAVMEEHLDLGYLFAKAELRMDGAFVQPLEKLMRGEPLANDA